MAKVKDFNIGEFLYRWVTTSGVWKFQVIGKRETEAGHFLELRCLECKHGYKCEVLVTDGDYDKIIYVHMLNNHEGNDQRHWHVDAGDKYHFFENEELAKQEAYKVYIREYKAEIQKLEESVAYKKKKLVEIELLLQAVSK